jgi:hypothetical protein
VPFSAAPKVYNRAFSITADVQIPEAGADGVLVAHGGRVGGYTFFVKDNRLHFVYNFLGRDGLYSGTHPVSAANVQLVAAVSTSLLTTFSIRMAAVFTLVVTTVGRRNGIVPSWLVVVGYLTAVVLLFAPPRTLWATLLLPVWVFLLSVYLIFGSAQTEGRPPTAVSTAAG